MKYNAPHTNVTFMLPGSQTDLQDSPRPKKALHKRRRYLQEWQTNNITPVHTHQRHCASAHTHKICLSARSLKRSLLTVKGTQVTRTRLK